MSWQSEILDTAAADPLVPLPVLMHRDDIIVLKQAAHTSGKSEKTLRGWCREFGIGRQSRRGAPIEISAPGLEMVLHGDKVALELLRGGERTHPSVQRYFNFLGIQA